MREIPDTDLFHCPGDCRFITVNTVGAMGAGIAKVFRDSYPNAYWAYKARCRKGYFHLGVPELITTEDQLKWVLFPTKQNWQDPSRYEWLHWGLQYIIDNIGEPDYIEPHWQLVIPPLGCGHGQLDYTNVRRLLQMFDDHIPNPITVIQPRGYQL